MKAANEALLEAVARRGGNVDSISEAEATELQFELETDPRLMGLLWHGRTNLLAAIAGPLQHCPVAQLALRPPGYHCEGGGPSAWSPVDWWDLGWHIDGLPEGTDMHPWGTIRNFTAIIGIALRDVPAPFCGNLVVFPGSHHLLAGHAQHAGLAELEGRGWGALPTPAELGARPAEQVCLAAGDAVLMPYFTGHAIAPNASDRTRCMAYYRLFATSHPQYQYKPQAMLSPWDDWPYLD